MCNSITNFTKFISVCLLLMIFILSCSDDDSPLKSKRIFQWYPESDQIMRDVNSTIIDVGLYAVPDLVDIDNDGDQDLFIGEWFGKITFYENTGTPLVPEWTFITDNFSNIDVDRSAAPTFFDYDFDGDYDIFIGANYTVGHLGDDGKIFFYENQGTPENYNFVLITESYVNFTCKGMSKPSFADVDYDGDFDIIVGYSSTDVTGSHEGLLYFRNDVINDSSYFNLVTTEFLTWGNIGLGINDNSGHVTANFQDINLDSYVDCLLITDYKGFYYGSIQANSSIAPKRDEITDDLYHFLLGRRLTGTLADINNDSILDVVTGIGLGWGNNDTLLGGRLYLSYGRFK